MRAPAMAVSAALLLTASFFLGADAIKYKFKHYDVTANRKFDANKVGRARKKCRKRYEVGRLAK